MAGEAKSDNFMLGTATFMIGPRDKLYDLNPDEHSVGLVKNFQTSGTKEQATLGQGVRNDEVFAVVTASPVSGSFEMYEYTEGNLAYALGLDGSTYTEKAGDAFTTSGDVSFSTGSAAIPITDGVGQDVQVGEYLSLRTPSTDNIVIAKVTATNGISSGTASGGSATITVSIPDANSTQTIKAGSKVSVVSVLAMGDAEANLEYAAKVVGQLANGKWITLLYPKIRVNSGLSVAFSTDNFNNMPFEFTPMKPIAGDPFFAEFKGKSGDFIIDSVKSPLN